MCAQGTVALAVEGQVQRDAGVQHPHLNRATVAEACDLLTRRLGAQCVAAEPTAVEEIIAPCARLPWPSPSSPPARSSH
jgi:hypothetical protein